MVGASDIIDRFQSLHGKQEVHIGELKGFLVKVQGFLDAQGPGPQVSSIEDIRRRLASAIQTMTTAGASVAGRIDLGEQKQEEEVLAGLEKINDDADLSDDGQHTLFGFSDTAYKVVTEKILELINSNDRLPWHSPLPPQRFAFNMVSDKAYRGVNMYLNWAAMLKGYKTPAFLTFKQITAGGGKVKAGEKGFPVLYFKELYSKRGEEMSLVDESEAVGPDGLRDGYQKFGAVFYYKVWNYDQTTGLKEPKFIRKEKTQKEVIEAAKKIVDEMPSPPAIYYDRFNDAYYIPSKDEVHVPPIENYKTEQQFYSVLFHELTHSTGHASRVNRKMGKKGTEEYKHEELIAELGASFLCAESGILFHTLSNSAAYLKSYLNSIKAKMKADPKFIVQASSKAQAAVDFILNRKAGKAEKEKDTAVQDKSEVEPVAVPLPADKVERTSVVSQEEAAKYLNGGFEEGKKLRYEYTKTVRDGLAEAVAKRLKLPENLTFREKLAEGHKAILRYILEGDLPKKKPLKALLLDSDLVNALGRIYVNPIPQKPKKVSPEESLYPLLSEDLLRPAMTGVYWDATKKYMAATDGNVLAVINNPKMSISESVVKAKDGRIIDEKFPAYYPLIEGAKKDTKTIKPFKINVQDLADRVAGVKRATDFCDYYSKGPSILCKCIANGEQKYFTPALLAPVLVMLLQNGVKEAKGYLLKHSLVLTSLDESVYTITMEIRANDQRAYVVVFGQEQDDSAAPEPKKVEDDPKPEPAAPSPAPEPAPAEAAQPEPEPSSASVPRRQLSEKELIEDIPQQTARGAFNWTSFNPERRGDSFRQSYAEAVIKLYDLVRPKAEEVHQEEHFEKWFDHFRKKYRDLALSYLHSHANVASAAITGPANFPTARNQKRSRWADAHYERMIGYYNDTRDKMLREYTPRHLKPIKTGEADSLERLKEKLTALEKRHAMDKALAAFIRKERIDLGKEGHREKLTEKMLSLGYSQKEAEQIITFMVRFPGTRSFISANRLQEMKRIRDRITVEERLKESKDKAGGNTEQEIDGVKVIKNYELNRVQLKFPSRPEKEVIERLRRRGFRWTPSQGVWQRQLNTTPQHLITFVIRGELAEATFQEYMKKARAMGEAYAASGGEKKQMGKDSAFREFYNSLVVDGEGGTAQRLISYWSEGFDAAILEKAKELGRAAYEKGISAAAMDPQAMALVKQSQEGFATKIFMAWNEALNDARFAEGRKTLTAKKQEPASLSGAVKASDLAKMKFKTLPFQGKWKAHIGVPSENFSMMVWGKPKQGKTNYAFQLANYLSCFGPVLYVLSDEGIGHTVSEKIRANGLDDNPAVSFLETRQLKEVKSAIAGNAYRFVFIDLISNLKDGEASLDASAFHALRKKYPAISFIAVFSSTKSGNYRGSQDWGHDVDVMVDVVAGVASAQGRFGGGEYQIFPKSKVESKGNDYPTWNAPKSKTVYKGYTILTVDAKEIKHWGYPVIYYQDVDQVLGAANVKAAKMQIDKEA